MGKFFMIATTIIILIIVFIRKVYNKKTVYSLKKGIKDINNYYKSLFKERNAIGRLMQTILLVLAQIFMMINITTGIIKYLDVAENIYVNLIAKTIIIVFIMVGIYFIVGYILLISSKVYKLFYKVEDMSMKIDLLISYFILNIYFTILIFFPSEFADTCYIGMIGVAISHLLNLRILIKVIRNPRNISGKSSEKVDSRSIIIVSIVILIMIILNLFLGVCLVESMNANAYSGNPSKFDLFYYTIITFTTIGYGDIVPISVLAKLMSIIIAITSVICLTVFLGSVLGNKEEH